MKIKRFITRSLLATVPAALLLSSAGCSKPTEQQALKTSVPQSNIVVILIDTLRADHLPIYGYPKNTSPFLSELAGKGVVFEKAFSASSTTAPAVASIFTSLYPSQHGVIAGQGVRRALHTNHPDIVVNRIPEGLDTLAEVLKKAGYKTYGLTDNLNVCREMGFAQGFDKFEAMHQQTATGINKTLASWADEIKSQGRYFLYLHYMDPHVPYYKKAPWYEPSPDRSQRLLNAYDSEINFVDQKIKEMFELFHWDRNTLLIVVSDHGEEFQDHGGTQHGKTLYREVIHVPFIFYHPPLSARRVSEPVGTIDLLPTLAELLGVPFEPIWQGQSLAPALIGAPLTDQVRFAQLLQAPNSPRSDVRSAVSGAWHYLSIKPPKEESREELYNLKNDFAEKTNEISASPAIVQKLKEALNTVKDDAAKVKNEEVRIQINDETLKELKSLGYVN